MKLLLAAVIAGIVYLVAVRWAFRVTADDPYAEPHGHCVG